MRVLITGGAGFIGSHVVRRLRGRGADVRVYDNFTTGSIRNLEGVEVEVVGGDVRDAAAVRRAAEGCGAVVHLAAIVSVPRSLEDPAGVMEVNARGTIHVLDAAREEGAAAVYASSSSIYGDSPDVPKREDLPPSPKSPYAASKLAGEGYARATGQPVVSLRFFNVYGPRQDPESSYAAVVPRFLRAALRGEPATVYGDGLQTRDFTYVEDAAAAIEAALGAPKEAWGRVVNVARGEERTLLDLLAAVEKTLGRPVAHRFEPPRAGDVRRSVAATDEARRLLGFSCAVPLEEGLARTADHLRSTLNVER